MTIKVENLGRLGSFSLGATPVVKRPVGEGAAPATSGELASRGSGLTKGEIVFFTVSPPEVDVTVGKQQQFAVIPSKMNTKDMGMPTWLVLGGDKNGTIDANGLYTAPAKAVKAIVVASASGKMMKATVNVDFTTGAGGVQARKDYLAEWLKAQTTKDLYAVWAALNANDYYLKNPSSPDRPDRSLKIGQDEAFKSVWVTIPNVTTELRKRGEADPAVTLAQNAADIVKKMATRDLLALWVKMATTGIFTDRESGLTQGTIDAELLTRKIGPLTLGKDGKPHGPGIAEPPDLTKLDNDSLYLTWEAFALGATDPDPKTNLTKAMVEAELRARNIEPNAIFAARRQAAQQQAQTSGGSGSGGGGSGSGGGEQQFAPDAQGVMRPVNQMASAKVPEGKKTLQWIMLGGLGLVGVIGAGLLLRRGRKKR